MRSRSVFDDWTVVGNSSGPSDYDRTHRFTIVYIWDVPGPARGILKRALGGWSISGITSFQSGAPFSLQNGFDRNSNPVAPPSERRSFILDFLLQ